MVDDGARGLAPVFATVTPARPLLDPGQTRSVDVTLRARRPRFAGGELARTVTVRARGDNAGAAAAAARDVVFVQQRALPAWALVLGVVLVAAAAAAASQLPDRVSVPQVQDAPDVAMAAATRHAAGLELDPQLRSRTARRERPGTILDQIPGPGVEASRGDRVTLLVATGAARTVTPQLGGQTPARAQGAAAGSPVTGSARPAARALAQARRPLGGRRSSHGCNAASASTMSRRALRSPARRWRGHSSHLALRVRMSSSRIAPRYMPQRPIGRQVPLGPHAQGLKEPQHRAEGRRDGRHTRQRQASSKRSTAANAPRSATAARSERSSTR